MSYLLNILMVLALAAVSFTIGAQEVYKSVNEDGVVEYSDTPTPDAEQVDVKPNVVDVTPVAVPVRPPESSPTASEARAEPAPQSEEIYTEANRDREAGLARREIHNEASPPPARHEGANAGGRTHASPRR